MHFLLNYGLFFAKTLTIVLAIIVVLIAILALSSKGKDKSKPKLKVKKLNEEYEKLENTLATAILSKAALKKTRKQEKKRKKAEKKPSPDDSLIKKKRIFVLNFHGDVKASGVNQLRNEITALLTIATPQDEVVVCLESAGGLAHSYGLAASQLKRLRDRGIPLTVAIDKIAASGGYMMACVANKIIAAPFAIIGSIGVVAQIPNFHRYLKDKDIDFEQVTAGEYKRTLTVFGKNTDKGRQKMQEDIDEIHQLFKAFIIENRSWIDIDKVATGEHWQARRALELQLVDELKTSDDYLLTASHTAEIFEVKQKQKKRFVQKFATAAQDCVENIFQRLTYFQG